MEEMKEREWIDINLKLIIESKSSNLDYVNRIGDSANYNERDYVIETLGMLGLAKCDNFGGTLMDLGETIRDNYDGSYLNYLESIESANKTIANPTKKNIIQKIKVVGKFIGWVIMVTAAIFAIMEFLF